MKNKPNQNICICLGAPYHLPDLQKKEPVAWTVKNSCRIGDLAVFYLTAPISAVVGYGVIISEPYYESQSEWQDKYFAEIDRIQIYSEQNFISIKYIRQLFPEWRYWLQPRQSVIAPEDLTFTFKELLETNKK